MLTLFILALGATLFSPPAAGKTDTTGTQTIITIGAIADCQYADKEDRGDRRYRSCPGKLANALGTLDSQNLSFIVHLGDFIDDGWENFGPLLDITARSRHPFHFVLGNHDLSVAEARKGDVPARLGMPARYYARSHGDWMFLFLDGNDVSTYGWPAGSEAQQAADDIRQARFPDSETWNGAIGDDQLAWMDDQLTRADSRGTRVVLFSHFPVYPPNRHNLWNDTDVLALIDNHPSVAAWISGHNHDGNYGERNGVHHVNLKGMLDTEDTAFSVITFQPTRIEIDGYGRETDRILPLSGR